MECCKIYFVLPTPGQQKAIVWTARPFPLLINSPATRVVRSLKKVNPHTHTFRAAQKMPTFLHTLLKHIWAHHVWYHNTYRQETHTHILWQSCENHVTIMWRSCDNHVTISLPLLQENQPRKRWVVSFSRQFQWAVHPHYPSVYTHYQCHLPEVSFTYMAVLGRNYSVTHFNCITVFKCCSTELPLRMKLICTV